jgi:tetratricopeptide (TPR) repeat protein
MQVKGEGGKMTIKEQLVRILEQGREAELAFLADLTDEDKSLSGTYETWSAKDIIAHANYWADLRTRRILAWMQDEAPEPVPQYEEANRGIWEQFRNSNWDDIEAFAESTHAKVIEAVHALEEEVLNGPSLESEERKLWDAIVGVAYTHKLSHYSGFYQDHGQTDVAGKLWKEWAELVSPLDSGAEWQGGVHYNAACSLALAGDHAGALEELRKGLELRPGLRGWSRLDSDLAILHEDPAFKRLFATDDWWDALEASPQAEALADQFLRMFFMLRNAISRFPEEAWRTGDSLYQRPAGLALHILQSIDGYCVIKPGESSGDPLTQISWQERDSSKLPSQEAVLAYLEKVEARQASFIATSDLQAKEELFPWTGTTLLGRALYSLRHAQHHLADMAMELQRRGFRPPDWQ